MSAGGGPVPQVVVYRRGRFTWWCRCLDCGWRDRGPFWAMREQRAVHQLLGCQADHIARRPTSVPPGCILIAEVSPREYTLPLGTHVVDVICPRCKRAELVAVALHALLQIPDDDTPSLRVKLAGRPVDHDCDQTRIVLTAGEIDGQVTIDDTGEVIATVTGKQ